MRERRKKQIGLAVYALITLCILGFIFHNSLQDGAESGAQSSRIAEIIKPLFDPWNRIPDEIFHIFTRKLAHLTEFCLFGISVTLLSRQIRVVYGKYSLFFPLFFTLLCAVTDEFIQSFTGRTSSVQDVLIDFCGACIGFLLVHLCAGVHSYLHRRKEYTDQ